MRVVAVSIHVHMCAQGRIFMGLVKCGAWGCFDEFNRLKEDQLSAVSQQIQVIQAAIKDRTPSVAILGKTIEVNYNAGEEMRASRVRQSHKHTHQSPYV